MYRRFPRYPDDADYQTNAPSYYEDLARKQKLLKMLAEKIWEYDKRLDERLEDLENVLQDYLLQWDERIENLDDEVSHIFVTWLEDGTLEKIINHDVLGNKADKTDLDKTNRELSKTNEDLNNIKTRFIDWSNSDSAVTQLINTALTYTNRTVFNYGQEGTAVSRINSGQMIDGKYNIDCSSFVELVLRGVTYENSAYLNAGTNYPTNPSFYYDTTFPHKYDRFLANEQGHYAYEHGWSYRPNKDFSNVEPGDIMFFSEGEEPDKFRGVTHNGVVINNDQNDTITVIDVSQDIDTGAKVRFYYHDTLMDLDVFFARMPLKESTKEVNQIPNHQISSEVFKLKEPLNTRKIYTVIFESDMEEGQFTLGAKVDDIFYNFLPSMKRLPNNKFKAVFKPNSVTDIIRFYRTYDTQEMNLKNVVFYDGIVSTYENDVKDNVFKQVNDDTIYKFDNGLMMITKIIPFSNVSNPNGNIFMSDEIVWDFPESFVAGGGVFVNGSTPIGQAWVNTRATPTSTQAKIRVYSPFINEQKSFIYATAIGRWY